MTTKAGGKHISRSGKHHIAVWVIFCDASIIPDDRYFYLSPDRRFRRQIRDQPYHVFALILREQRRSDANLRRAK